MEPLICLFADDQQEEAKQYSENIRAQWLLKYKSEIKFIHKITVEESVDEFNIRPEAYQILIADMFFPSIDGKQKTERGLDIISRANRLKDALVIVGLSAGDLTSSPGLAGRACECGADFFSYKGELVEPGGFERFCDSLRTYLLKKHLIKSNIRIDYDKSQPKLTTIIEQVGLSNLELLYAQTLEAAGMIPASAYEGNGPGHATASYLAPGLSEALVLRLEARPLTAPVVTHFLKMSKSASRLQRELAHFPPEATYSSRLLVRYTPLKDGKIATAQDWYAISAAFEMGASTLRTWLAKEQAEVQISGVLHSLFLEGGLTNGYTPNQNKPPELSVVAVTHPSLSRQARILNALDELKDVIAYPEMGGQSNWPQKDEEIREFLLTKRLPGKRSDNLAGEFAYMCQCHGDLHGGNILVSGETRPSPLVIDASEFGQYHWATDYVRLIVDFIVAAYDRGIEQYRWNRFEHWYSLSRTVIENAHIPKSGLPSSEIQNGSVIHAIRWLINNLRQICPAVQTSGDLSNRFWELQLALGVEFLRAAYRADLSAPKRALGLVAGHLALSTSISTFRSAHAKNSD